MAAISSQPLIVRSDELERLFGSAEAVDGLEQAAAADASATAARKTAAAAAIGHAINALRRAEQAAENVPLLATPHDGVAARLQSLIASGEGGRLSAAPLQTGGFEAKFDTGDWIGWASVAWEKIKHPTKHPLRRPQPLASPFPDSARVAVLGDWGTGLYGAPEIALSIERDPDPFDLLLHLGDVYYSGTQEEITSRFLDLWPKRRGAISRALNSNHEMYSGGFAYFQFTLPKFEQDASYFAFQNKYWTLVGLDLAHLDHSIDDEQVVWLEEIVRKAGPRRIVLFSHHQLYSHFEAQGSNLTAHSKFGAILRSGQIYAWYWGHEHRCTIFEKPDSAFGLLGRCIGHGGMPQSRKATINLPRVAGARFQGADWRRSAAVTREGNMLSDAFVLEGENPFILGEEAKFSPHGYAVLTFDGPRLVEQIRTPEGAVILETVLGG